MRISQAATLAAALAVSCLAPAQTVNPGNNPLLGRWVYSSGGIGKYGCAKTRTFSPKAQTFEFQGSILTRDVHAYAVSGKTIYVQEHTGSGGTVAYEMVSPNEMMDTIGTGACHWKRG